MAVSGISGIGNSIGNVNTDSATRALDNANDQSFEAALKSAVEKKDDKELKSACKQFEGIMLNMLYKQMKATIIKSDLYGQDAAMDIYQGMLDDELMNTASDTSTFGLAEALYKQLSKQSGIGEVEDKATNVENQGNDK